MRSALDYSERDVRTPRKTPRMIRKFAFLAVTKLLLDQDRGGFFRNLRSIMTEV